MRSWSGSALRYHAQWLLAPVHQSLEQLEKQLPAKSALIGCKPERPFGIDGRGHTDALALSGPGDHRSVTAFGPGLSVQSISAKTRFVPEIDLGFFPPGLENQCLAGIMMPVLHHLRITLIGALQRLVRHEAEPGKQGANRGDPQRDAEFLDDQLEHNRTRPQSKIKTILQRILAIDPAKDLALLGCREIGRAARTLARGQRTLGTPAPTNLVGATCSPSRDTGHSPP